MKPPAAVVAPARSLAQLGHELDMLCGSEERSVAEFKAKKTRLFIEARSDPSFGARGDGFVKFVEERGRVDYATAHRWMTAAGWKPPRQSGAGAKPNQSQNEIEPKPERRADSDETASDDEEKSGEDATASPAVQDWDVAQIKICDRVKTLAAKFPDEKKSDLAFSLRQLADTIEEMRTWKK